MKIGNMGDKKELKKLLKEAKEALTNKEFEKCIGLSKEVLKADRNNYLALVVLGAGMQNTDQSSHAPKAYHKAIEIDPDQILAWQGLASYYEKEEQADSDYERLLNVYQNILKLESPASKWCCTFDKFAKAVMETKQLDAFIQVVEEHRGTDEDEKLNVLWPSVEIVLTNIAHPLERKHYDLLYEALNINVKDSKQAMKKLITLLYLKKDIEQLAYYTERVDLIDTDIGGVLCKLYAELSVEQPSRIEGFRDLVERWLPVLSQENANNPILPLCKAANYLKSSSCSEARDVLESYFTSKKTHNSWHGQVMLGRAHLKLLCYEQAENCAYAAKHLKPSPEFHALIDTLLLEAIVHSDDEEKCKESIEISKKLLIIDRSNTLALEYMTRANINLGNWDVVEKLIRKLEMTEGCDLVAVLLGLQMAEKKDGKVPLDKLNSIVEQYPESAEAWYLLGIHNLRADNLQSGIMSLLKAAKRAPYWYTVYLQLGLYYKSCNDLDRARRCLKKALYLNRHSDEVGIALSDVYRAQGDHEMNLDLLNAVAKTTGSKWAWLQLGVQYSAMDDINAAIKCLLIAIRNDPTDSECWEVLADSYLSRGAFMAALKSYQKVVQLKPGALYPALQIAGTKLLIGEFEDSLSEYRQLVTDNPKNVPALKGLTEACLKLAQDFYERRLLGLTRDYLQEALNAIASALNERRDLSCIWKLMGDILMQGGDLPSSWSYLTVPGWICRKENNENVTLKTLSLYELSTRCYAYALQLIEKTGSTSLLWHDLSASYVSQTRLNTDPMQKKQLMQKAFDASKRSISLNSGNWKHWNLLGLIAGSPEINEKPLAQHSFIQSILAEEKNSVAWTNLGVMYFELQELDLANKSFKAAQRINDTYNQSWIGQALIAEKLNHPDTLDLFRHTTQLGFHPESAISYAQHVLHTLKMEIVDRASKEFYEYGIEKMAAVAVARDAMTMYTEEKDNSSCGLNMLGCLQERTGLYDSAVTSYNTALSLLENQYRNDTYSIKNYGDELQMVINNQRSDIVRTNLGRTLLRANRNEEAISVLQRIKERGFQTDCNLALAYFKAGKVDESVKQYNSILNKYLHPDKDNERVADIMVAKAAAYYKKNDTDAAGTQLKECRMLKQKTKHPYVHGLFAEFAFCILERDLDSSKEILKLMRPLLEKPEYITDISTFDAYTRFIEEDLKGMVGSLAKSVHSHPWQASLWLKLAVIIVERHFNSNSNDPNIAEAAARCANIAMRLGRGTSMDVKKVLPIASVSHLLSGNTKRSLMISKKAVHLYPNVAEGWAVLLAASSAVKCSSTVAQALLSKVRENLDSKNYLSDWVNAVEIKIKS